MRRCDHTVFDPRKQRITRLGRLVRMPARAALQPGEHVSRRDIPRDKTAIASAYVVGSGVQGPDAISVGASPVTSEIISASTRAPRRAAAIASRPPAICDKCLRTMFISPIGAPLASSIR